MGIERRRHPRHDLLAHVRVRSGAEYHILEVTNVSLSGAFVSTTGMAGSPFGKGQVVEMSLFLAGEVENVPVSGRVVRLVDRSDPEVRGFGAEFVDVDARARDGIARLLVAARASLAPPPPGPRPAPGPPPLPKR